MPEYFKDAYIRMLWNYMLIRVKPKKGLSGFPEARDWANVC